MDKDTQIASEIVGLMVKHKVTQLSRLYGILELVKHGVMLGELAELAKGDEDV